MEVIMYTTDCPKCKILERRLEQKNIDYKKITDIDIMLEKKIRTAPFLEVDGQLMKFEDAWKWLSKQED